MDNIVTKITIDAHNNNNTKLTVSYLLSNAALDPLKYMIAHLREE